MIIFTFYYLFSQVATAGITDQIDLGITDAVGDGIGYVLDEVYDTIVNDPVNEGIVKSADGTFGGAIEKGASNLVEKGFHIYFFFIVFILRMPSHVS
jgi:hypothetical protein